MDGGPTTPRERHWRRWARHLRVWRRFVIMAFVREAAYHAHFVVGRLDGIAQLALAVTVFLLVYRYTDAVAGWSRDEALLLTGIYRIVEGLIALQIAPNMRAIAGYIRRGELDFYLLRPVSSQFLVSLRRLQPDELGNVLVGLGLAVYAGNAAGVRWGAAGLVEAAAFLLRGLVLLYALWFATVTLAFWLVQVDTLDLLFYSLFETARYPVSYFAAAGPRGPHLRYPGRLRHDLPGAGPPCGAERRLLPLGILLAAGALLGSRAFWNAAVRHYGSASS